MLYANCEVFWLCCFWFCFVDFRLLVLVRGLSLVLILDLDFVDTVWSGFALFVVVVM